MNKDLINGILETIGTLTLTWNVYKLYRDKEINGVSPWPTLFFTILAAYTVYFYFSMNQWYSFIGATGIVLMNSIWLLQILWYSKIRKLIQNYGSK